MAYSASKLALMLANNAATSTSSSWSINYLYNLSE